MTIRNQEGAEESIVAQASIGTNRLLSWQQAGYPRPVDYDHSNFFQKLLAAWASPFMERGMKVRGFAKHLHKAVLISTDFSMSVKRLDTQMCVL
jgi:hypothetical protein